MIRVGLIGENPNDTNSFSNLFSRIYPGKFYFFPLIRNRTGGQLDDIKEGSKTLIQLQFEYEFEKPDFVVLIRDLDAIESDIENYNDRLTRMYFVGNAVTHNSVYLLCIWEMETLLLADLSVVNKKYGTSISYPLYGTDPADPMLKPDPKGELNNLCGYHQSDCPELFGKVNFIKLLKIRFFRDFLEKFEERL